jgi:hypothetical protein
LPETLAYHQRDYYQRRYKHLGRMRSKYDYTFPSSGIPKCNSEMRTSQSLSHSVSQPIGYIVSEAVCKSVR